MNFYSAGENLRVFPDSRSPAKTRYPYIWPIQYLADSGITQSMFQSAGNMHSKV